MSRRSKSDCYGLYLHQPDQKNECPPGTTRFKTTEGFPCCAGPETRLPKYGASRQEIEDLVDQMTGKELVDLVTELDVIANPERDTADELRYYAEIGLEDGPSEAFYRY